MNKTLARIVAIVGIVGFAAAAGLFIYLRTRRVETKLIVPPHLRKGFTEGKETIERLRKLDEMRQLLKEDRAEGIKRLEEFAVAHPNTSEAGEAHILIAEALGEEGKIPEALEHIPPAIAAPGGPRRATRARLLRAKLLLHSDPQAARKDLEAVLADNLHPDLQLQARLLIGRLEMAAGNFDRAIETLSLLTERNYPQKEDALKAIRQSIEARLAELARSGDPKVVLQWGDQMARRFPQVEGLAEVVRFRQAEALRKLGQFARARRILGELAAQKEALAPEFDLEAELARVAQAEAAAGVVRTRQAFFAAKRQGKETRRAFEGEISADTRWSPADGPLVLTGKTTVAEGATLTIEAGLTVHFVIGAQLAVQGALVAKGTAEKPVIFTSVATRNPSPFDGEGVVIARSSGERSALDHCVFEFQRVGLTVVGASPLIRDCTFRRNGQAGLAGLEGRQGLEVGSLHLGQDPGAEHLDHVADGVHPGRAEGLLVTGIPHLHDDLGDPEGMGQDGEGQVVHVLVEGPDGQVGLFGARLLDGADVQGAPVDGDGPGVGVDVFASGLVLLDDHHVVAAVCELFGQGPPGDSASGDDHIHGFLRVSMRAYLLQAARVKRIATGRISSLPASIPKT